MKTIYSFQQGRYKRQISLDYNYDDSGIAIDLQTPLKSMKRIQLKSDFLSDNAVTV